MVVGAGPNGLAAAVTLARAGWSVRVVEGRETIGGGTRTAELTLPGFRHDVCSAVHPMAAGSPFFRELPLAEHGLELAAPRAAARPSARRRRRAAALARSVDETVEARSTRRTGGPTPDSSGRWLGAGTCHGAGPARPLSPSLWRSAGRPSRWRASACSALRSASGLARARFDGDRARALFAGLAAHSCCRSTAPRRRPSRLVLGAAGHAVGWPIPRGGSQAIADALAAYLRSLGGEIETGRPCARSPTCRRRAPTSST